MMEKFFIIIAYILIGMGLKRIPKFPGEAGNVLNSFVINISLPAIILLNIPRIVFSTDFLIPVILPWVILVLSCLGVLFLSYIFIWGRQITGSLLLLVPLGNTSFLGIPMVEAFFGDQGITYAVIYDQLGSFPALATYGSVIVALYGREESKTTLKEISKKIITFPPFIALCSAFVLRTVAYPAFLADMLKALGGTLVPLVMIAVGFQLTLRLEKGTYVPLILGLMIKLIAAPIIALILCRVIGIEGEAVRVSIFEAGMPPMVSAGALAILAGLSPSLSAALVGLGIMASFITLPMLYCLL